MNARIDQIPEGASLITTVLQDVGRGGEQQHVNRGAEDRGLGHRSGLLHQFHQGNLPTMAIALSMSVGKERWWHNWALNSTRRMLAI